MDDAKGGREGGREGGTGEVGREDVSYWRKACVCRVRWRAEVETAE